MSRMTRLILVEPNGRERTDAQLNLTGFPNANAQSPLMVSVQQECDMGHWHQVGAHDLPLYDVEPGLGH